MTHIYIYKRIPDTLRNDPSLKICDNSYFTMKATAAVLIALTLLAAVTLWPREEHTSSRALYQEWKTEHGQELVSSPSEDEYRFKIFEENLRIINDHNAKLGKTYTMGVNQFTGYSEAEFNEIFLHPMSNNPSYVPTEPREDPKIGLDVDWVTMGAVSMVKTQGNCNADYAFSTAGGMQGAYFLQGGQLVEFSAQELVDCSRGYGNGGCKGGNMYNSYRWEQSNGASTRASYPYQAKEQSCHTGQKMFRINGFNNVTSCADLDNAIQQRPVSVAVDASNFRNYHGGILDNCGYTLSYGTLLVGATDYYYKLKLSWGPSFGEAGYIRLQKRDNMCGICQQASFPF